MNSMSLDNGPKRVTTLRERMHASLGDDVMRDFYEVSWKWRDNERLDVRASTPTAELVAWVWERLLAPSASKNILEVFQKLGGIFVEGSSDQLAIDELRSRVAKGDSLYDIKNPLLWQCSAELASLAEHVIHLSEQGAVTNLCHILISFCPWAKNYEEAHRAIKESIQIQAWDRRAGFD
jgi:hypothetical protein